MPRHDSYRLQKLSWNYRFSRKTVGAISYASNFDFLPSTHGVLIHFNCEDIEQTLEKVLLKGGKVVIPKTKIEADDKGWFAVFTDSEGNRIGVYAEK